jgi:hypothetical protein
MSPRSTDDIKKLTELKVQEKLAQIQRTQSPTPSQLDADRLARQKREEEDRINAQRLRETEEQVAAERLREAKKRQEEIEAAREERQRLNEERKRAAEALLASAGVTGDLEAERLKQREDAQQLRDEAQKSVASAAEQQRLSNLEEERRRRPVQSEQRQIEQYRDFSCIISGTSSFLLLFSVLSFNPFPNAERLWLPSRTTRHPIGVFTYNFPVGVALLLLYVDTL